MPVRVPIVRPDLGPEEAEAAARVVRSGWVMQGPEVAAFEREFAAAVGAVHAVAVASGTVALELSLRVLGVGPGDEVATVSHSFIATANAVLAVGARPVFVDVERDTLGMDPARLAPAIGPRTRAVLCAHQLGFPCDLDGIGTLAAARGLPVIEDAACALGSEAGGVRLGRPHGRLACFSFHPRKVITTGDGGMITTADPDLAARLRLLRSHGMTLAAEARDKDPLAREAFVEPAFNARLTDLAAAVGRPQLRRLDASLAERRRLAAAFTAALADHPLLLAPAVRPGANPNWQSFPVFLRPGSGAEQEALLRWFFDRGISCRRGLGNAHQEPAYAGRANWSGGPLPVSEELRTHTLLLPLFQGMTPDEEGAILQALRDLRGAP
jgi:dTDP-4-amino-4,6-dideoxygalactose transaminase